MLCKYKKNAYRKLLKVLTKRNWIRPATKLIMKSLKYFIKALLKTCKKLASNV